MFYFADGQEKWRRGGLDSGNASQIGYINRNVRTIFLGFYFRYRFKSRLDLGPTHAQGENGMKSISFHRSGLFPLGTE